MIKMTKIKNLFPLPFMCGAGAIAFGFIKGFYESKEGMDFKNEKFELPKLFEKIYCSAYLNMAKPNKDIYKYLIKDADLDLSTTIFIDNQIKNVQTAESLGIKSILFENLEQL